MILTFSQGINTYSTVSGQPGDTPNFLVAVDTNSKVDLHAPLDQPFQLAFTHRDSNYLLTVEENGDVEAWGYGSAANNNAPFTVAGGSGPNLDEYYLYVDLDLATGATSYGYSVLEPQEGSVPQQTAQNRVNGQHWFDTVANAMFVWNASGIPPSYGRFTEKVRCFIAKYQFGSGFISMSINSPSFIGTTVGLPYGSYRVGSLTFDHNGNVLKRTDTNNKNTFFTTEEIFATGLPTSSRTRLESFVIDGIAQTPIAAYQAVYFSGLNQILPLTPNVQDNAIFGIIEQPAGTSGDLVKVTTDGVINNAAWSWINVNEQIYVDSTQPGVLTSVESGYSPLPGQKPIAIAIDATTILLRASELLLAAGGLDTFVELNDTPSTYGSESERLVKVNGAETALEFGAELGNLDDVDVLTPVPGHVLHYGAFSLWESDPVGSASGVQAWDVHLDQVAAATPTSGNALIYDGSPAEWNARDLVENDISDLGDYMPFPGGNGIVVRTSATTTVSRSITTSDATALSITNGDGVSGNVLLTPGANLSDIAALSAATDQFIVGLSGDFVAKTPAEVKAILPAYALSEMSDVDFVGSPAAPVNGDVLTYDGSDWQALPASGGGLPASVTECNILVADGAGGWNEQAILELPIPYDIAAQSFGTIPTATIIMKVKLPRPAVIVDYGHQMDVETGPGGSPADSTFFVTVNGTTTTGSPNDVIGTMTFDDAGNNPHFDFFSAFTYLSAGDIVRIISPIGNNTGLEDVGLTLRAFVEPVIPCGSLSVSWGAAQYNDPTSTNGVTVTGSYTHLEFAVTHASSDGVTYYALDDASGHGYGNTIGVNFDGTPMNSESKYYNAVNSVVTGIGEITGSSLYYRIRCTAFGPGGIETDTTVFKFSGV